MNNLSTSDIKEKLIEFKNELFNSNNNNNNNNINNNSNNNRIKKDLNEYGNQKSDFYKTEKMKNKIV